MIQSEFTFISLPVCVQVKHRTEHLFPWPAGYCSFASPIWSNFKVGSRTFAFKWTSVTFRPVFERAHTMLIKPIAAREFCLAVVTPFPCWHAICDAFYITSSEWLVGAGKGNDQRCRVGYSNWVYGESSCHERTSLCVCLITLTAREYEVRLFIILVHLLHAVVKRC